MRNVDTANASVNTFERHVLQTLAVALLPSGRLHPLSVMQEHYEDFWLARSDRVRLPRLMNCSPCAWWPPGDVRSGMPNPSNPTPPPAPSRSLKLPQPFLRLAFLDPQSGRTTVVRRGADIVLKSSRTRITNLR